MVRTRRTSSQDFVEEGLARVLEFDNVVEEQEMDTIPEILEDPETRDQISQPEISAACDSGDEEEKLENEVNSIRNIFTLELYEEVL